MILNETKFGFKVSNIRPLDELGAQFVEMEHIRTGLRLVWIDRAEENKTFGIAFKTLPFDDTGVFHILEHSVLCGSKKYPVKEPFVDLLQTSMNTFLNALTFPDKTLYPISSRNDKDFFNLMSVYLDAVFCPSIYTNKAIFQQEGWHYEFDEEDNVSYKGVVFNEMKGALASADELEEVALNRALFPDTAYRFVSGGDPASIPDLTYSKFLDTHKKFYNPSNAYVFLDGDVDIDKVLELLDSEYLGRIAPGKPIEENLIQAAVDGGVSTVEYELGEDEENKNKTRIAYAGVISTFDEREKIVGMQILSDVLCGSNQSLLTKEILARSLAEDVTMQVCDSVAQPWVKLELQNVTDGRQEEAEALVWDILSQLAQNGVNRAQLEASMANLEFQMRERDFGSMPQGIVFSFIALETWLYGGDPMKHLVIGDLFDSLKEKMNDGFFEKLIKELLIENPHRAKAVLIPSYTIGKERREKENKRIKHEAESWEGTDKRERLKREQKILLTWQEKEDSEEAVATLPKLELSDVSPEPECLPVREIDANGVRALFHEINCAGVLNYALYFDAEDLTENEICVLSFITDILGKMKTEKHSEDELDTLGRLLFGSFDFSVSSNPVKSDIEKCKIKLCSTFSTLEKNVDKALSFIKEVLSETCFDNDAVAFDLLKQLKTRYFRQFVMSGSSVGAVRVKAGYSASAVASECSGGIEYYKWLCDQEHGWCWKELRGEITALLDRLVCQSRMTISLTGGSEEMLISSADKLSDGLAVGVPCGDDIVIKPWGKRREGIIIPADISFACAGGVVNDFNIYNGSQLVATRIISLDYLWNTVRVQGGAYGCGSNMDFNGFAFAYSYRDPNAAGSLNAFDNITKFIDDVAEQEVDLTGFIIGTIAAASPLYTPKMKGYMADREYMRGITYEDKKHQLEQMLATTNDDLKTVSAQLNGVFENGGICVLGSREQLEKCNLDDIFSL